MEFHRRNEAIGGPELAELVSISPDEEAIKQGFRLPDPEVDDIIRVARDLEACSIVPDTGLTAEENVELLLRAARLLQLGLEVQLADNSGVVEENNGMRDELRMAEDRNRELEAEISELRERLDQEGSSGDVRELERELRDARRAFADERKANDRLIQQSDRDKQTIDDLETRVARSVEDVRRKEDEMQEIREQMERLREDYEELRQQHNALQAASSTREQQREMGDTIRQQDWKIERLTKDNRALEAANVELRSAAEAVKEENLQVSEKILGLDEECKRLRVKEGEAAAKVEALGRERSALLSTAEELRTEVADKMTLLDEFEDRFNRQYRSWEEERSTLEAQIEALHREAKANAQGQRKAGQQAAGGSECGDSEADESPEAQLADIKRQLDEAKEKEILLLEAYEQLERDVAKEVDRALARQADELGRLGRRAQFLEGALEGERKHTGTLSEQQAALEQRLQDALARNQQYEAGVYGLPQAAQELRGLKEQLAATDTRTKELVSQVNKLSAALEDCNDENTLLRRKAGLPPGQPLDVTGLKMQRGVTIAQLRSVNALLERQVSDLEEERRKLRLEVKFRAKYHGKAALEMGLAPEQLLLLEEYVEGLKNGRNPEANLVAQLQQRIEFLEVRLAEVMAYADIPINMRPTLTELQDSQLPAEAAAVVMLSASTSAGGAMVGGGGGSGHAALSVKVTQLELVRSAVLNCVKLLRQMSESLAEHRQVSDADYRNFLNNVIDKMVDAEKVATLVLKDVSAAHKAGASGIAEQQHEMPQRHARPPPDENFMADAAADELRDRLRELARQVVDLQVAVAHKDAQLHQLQKQRQELEKRLGADKALASRHADYVPREDHEDTLAEVTSLKVQLIEALEELGAREKEVAEVSGACGRYQYQMQEVADTVKLLYKDYANATATWRSDKAATDKQLKKAQDEAATASAANKELEAGLATLEKGRPDEIKQQYIDTVRRMAIVQIKHAKLARELVAATSNEKALAERLEESEEELRDMSSTCRARMRWMEAAAGDAARRVEQLFRALQGSAPLEAYQALTEKHTALASELRRLTEERGDSIAAGSEELLRARHEVAQLTCKYEAICANASEIREKLRQAELIIKQTNKASGPAGGKGSHRSALHSASADVALSFNQDLVSARVQLDSLTRRQEMAEREKERTAKTLEENQERLTEMEQRLAQVTAELATSRAMEGRLQQRLHGSKSAAEVEEVMRRMDAAESNAAQAEAAAAGLTVRAEEAERKLFEGAQQKQRQLADITNLRTAMRELMGHSDQAAALGKLHLELDHARGKEALARAALNRSEMNRLELERVTRALRQDVTRLGAQLAIQQDRARWSEKELQEAQTRLELGLAGRTESWKASLWARKLEQLKSRNDGMAEGLEAALRRVSKLEDEGQEALLRADLAQDVEVLLSKGVSDVYRECGALKEQAVQLRLEAGKLGRSELVMRQKVSYLERVNAELSELLDRCDAETLTAQSTLECDKRELSSHSRALQDEVSRLQERCAVLLGDLEEQRSARAAAGGLRASAVGVGGEAAMVTSGKQALGDRELMLRQIESVKLARQEAEHLRQECRRLENELGVSQRQLDDLQHQYDEVLEVLRNTGQSQMGMLGDDAAQGTGENALGQLRAVSEAAIRDLQAKVKDREAQLAALTARMEEHQAAYLAQHAIDRKEIAKLTSAMYETGAASIAGWSSQLMRASTTLAATGDGREDVPYEQLKALLEERGSEIDVLRNRLEQKEASLEVLRRNFEDQSRAQDAEISRLSHLAAQPRDDAPSRVTVQKLHTELKLKDERLRQLRSAIKALEGKLSELLKEKTDLSMHKSSWREQELLDDRLGELQAQKAEVAAELDRTCKELEGARKELGAREAQAKKLGAQLLRDAGELARTKSDLAREQALVRLLRSKGSKEGPVAEAAATVAQQQAVVLQLRQRVKTLEHDIKQLQEALQKAEYAQKVAAKAVGPAASAQAAGAPISSTKGGSGPMSMPTARLFGSEAGGMSDMEGTFRIGAVYDHPSTSEGGASVPRSSEGGASVPRSSEGGASVPRSSDGDDSIPSSSEGGAAGAAGADARPQMTTAQWQETKRLQARLEGLKKKLSQKSDELERALKDGEKRAAQVVTLQGEKDRAMAQLKATQERMKQGPANAPQLAGDARAQLAQYVQRVVALEQERDELTVRLQRAQQTQQPQQSQSPQQPTPQQQQRPQPSTTVATTSSSNASSLAAQQELFELRLQRDQAQASVRRLRERITELFGPTAVDEPQMVSPSTGAKRSGSEGGASGGGAKRQKSAQQREADLLGTVNQLKSALERAMTSTTPNTRFMQEVRLRKEAQKEAEKLRADVAPLKQHIAVLEFTCAELRAAAAVQRQGSMQGQATPPTSHPQQQQQLQAALAQRDAELGTLRQQVADLQRRASLASSSTSGSRDHGKDAPSADTALQLVVLKERVEALEAENDDLKAELNAFDPQFFDEIEDLKHDHHQLKQRAAAQEATIKQLRQQVAIGGIRAIR